MRAKLAFNGLKFQVLNFYFKGAVMKIEQPLINDRLRVSNVS